MGKKSKFSEPRILTLAQQRVAVSSHFPGFRFTGNHTIGRWIGSLTPGDQFETYQVKIEYRLRRGPKITVLSPKLEKRDDQSVIPHVYLGDHPCVYFPTTGEWHSGKLIGNTIIPWLSTWLYFYEVWLVTGKWKGEGIDHGQGGKE
jgi:hypothetical protein